MARTLVLVDDLSHWSPYYPDSAVIDFPSFAAMADKKDPGSKNN